MKWINVKDKSPEIGQAVLIFQTYPKDFRFNCLSTPLDRCNYEIAEFRGKELYVNINYDHFPFVSHWMPLPEKPDKVG